MASERLERARWIDIPSVVDPRGVLTSVEAEGDVPFPIKRIFYMHHIETDRGGHAHRDTEQLVVALSGCFEMELSDGQTSREFELADPARGVYTPPMIFIQLRNFSPGAVCLVLASTHYDMSRSLRSWDEYLAALGAQDHPRASMGRASGE
jgi:hypothetical protein